MKYTSVIIVFLMAVMTLTGCGKENVPKAVATAIGTRAIAVVHPTVGHQVHGVIQFEQVEGGVHVVAKIMNLTGSTHGFHIHEYGDSSAPDGTSAGGHFNPSNHAHSGPKMATRHAGDLGNIIATPMGLGVYDDIDTVIQLSGPDSIIGRSVVIHADSDDLKSQPTGGAGKRIAVGVIGIAKNK